MSREHKSEVLEAEAQIIVINNTLENLKHIRESSFNVPAGNYLAHLKEVLRIVEDQAVVLQLMRQKRMKHHFFDVQSAIQSSLYYDKKLKLPDGPEESSVFAYELLLFMVSTYERFSIFDAIFPYRRKTEAELIEEEKKVVGEQWRISHEKLRKLLTRRREDEDESTSSENFSSQVVIPFIRGIELDLVKMRIGIETKRSQGVHINIAAGVTIGDGSAIGHFQDIDGDINSHNQIAVTRAED